jgi:hypothetical protein
MPDDHEVITLLTSMKESLERQMTAGFNSLEARFDGQAARLDRHAALLQTGSRWVNRMNQWHERQDRMLADLQKRVAKLEADKPEK